MQNPSFQYKFLRFECKKSTPWSLPTRHSWPWWWSRSALALMYPGRPSLLRAHRSRHQLAPQSSSPGKPGSRRYTPLVPVSKFIILNTKFIVSLNAKSLVLNAKFINFAPGQSGAARIALCTCNQREIYINRRHVYTKQAASKHVLLVDPRELVLRPGAPMRQQVLASKQELTSWL